MKSFLCILDEHLEILTAVGQLNPVIEEAGSLLITTLREGGKILLCGNGGSAADCQHLAAEFIVPYEQFRPGLAAIALTTDTSILTAGANDFGYEQVFARQVEALGNPKDCLIAISTSGNSDSILKAVQAANKIGMAVIGMTGLEGGKLAELTPRCVKIPSNVTARIQEAHIVIGHWWCGLVESTLTVPN